MIASFITILEYGDGEVSVTLAGFILFLFAIFMLARD